VRVLALVTALLLLLPGLLDAVPLSPRIANYRIEATLDPQVKTVVAHQVLTWRNTTAEPTRELWFHLYLNAFSNNRTLLLGAQPERVRRWQKRYPDEWGGIDVKRIRVGTSDLTDRLKLVPPPAGNPYDRTVAKLELAYPVGPGQAIEVEMDFDARLPRSFMRAGHAAPFFLVAQWFPKIGVFEDGAWNCHHYHQNTEFYADFGVYEVTLRVPKDYVVGHTGVRQSESTDTNGIKTIRVLAEDVHDFAWTADPRFVAVEDRVGGTYIRLLLQPNHAEQAERHLGAVKAAMQKYHQWFGEYPYPELTIVDPGPGALASGGMEYPMLITAGTTWWMPAWLRLPEMLVVHEFGHQYWYGILANNEFEEAWLDEGINSFVEGKIMDELYGPRASYAELGGIAVDAIALHRLGFLGRASVDPIARPAFAMLDRASYASTSYAKTALALHMLDRHLGGDRLMRALGDYARAWRFRHPTGKDFRRSIEKSTGEDLEWFFGQVWDGTAVLDYAVTRVDVRELEPVRGRGIGEAAEEVPRYRSEVVVERLGELRMPVEVVVVFEDGSETREAWDGKDRWRRLEFVGNRRVEYAVADPAHELTLDVNRTNNSRMRQPGTRGVIRLAGHWALWMQSALHLLTAF